MFDGEREALRTEAFRFKRIGVDSGRVDVSISVPKPKLWWPNKLGERNLHHLELRVKVAGRIVAQRCVRVGFRHLELVRRPDPRGESFFFRINGQPMFSKGANWVPPDPFPHRVPDSTYIYSLNLVKNANMNMLRVWGGGAYERDLFYKLCDQFGILVWQDFMFACCSYPADKAFLNNVQEEAVHQVRRRSHHACLALWCGNNENGNVHRVWKRSESHSRLLEADYQALEKTLAGTVAKEDPERIYWPSSPWPDAFERRKEREKSKVLGDSHIWNLDAHRGEFSSYYYENVRFVSEFGFQSFPNSELWEKWLDRGDATICSRGMDHHQRKKGGTGVILDYLIRHFPLPSNMKWLCHLSQLTQGLALKAAVEGGRHQKPFTMGTLYWQFNDTWPAVSWASVDVELRPKAVYYFAKRFFAPLTPAFHQKSQRIELWLLNDLPEPMSGAALLEVWSTSGVLQYQKSIDFKLEQNKNHKLCSVSRSWLNRLGFPKEEMLLRCHVQEKGLHVEACHFLVPFKHLKLKRPGIKYRRVGKTLEISVTAPALFVHLEPTDKLFSDNDFHLFPGDEKKICSDCNVSKVRVTSLFDCPGVSW